MPPGLTIGYDEPRDGNAPMKKACPRGRNASQGKVFKLRETDTAGPGPPQQNLKEKEPAL